MEFSEERVLNFSDIQTEYLCLKKFQNLNTYIPPEHYTLGQREDYSHNGPVPILKMVPVTAQFVPLRLVLKKNFEIPGYSEKTLDFMNSLLNNKSVISNFIQCRLWSDIRLKSQNKCGAVYVAIACLPPILSIKIREYFPVYFV